MAAPTLAELALQFVTQSQVALIELRRDVERPPRFVPELVAPSDSMDSLTNDGSVRRHIIDHRVRPEEDDTRQIHHGARAARG